MGFGLLVDGLRTRRSGLIGAFGLLHVVSVLHLVGSRGFRGSLSRRIGILVLPGFLPNMRSTAAIIEKMTMMIETTVMCYSSTALKPVFVKI